MQTEQLVVLISMILSFLICFGPLIVCSAFFSFSDMKWADVVTDEELDKHPETESFIGVLFLAVFGLGMILSVVGFFI